MMNEFDKEKCHSKKHKRKNKKSKHKKKNKKHKYKSSSSESSSSDNSNEEWVEKSEPSTSQCKEYKEKDEQIVQKNDSNSKRDDWMSISNFIPTISLSSIKAKKELEKLEKRKQDTYNPAENSRELNPYWKSSGTGLPSEQKKVFKKPESENKDYLKHNERQTSGNWRKKTEKYEHNQEYKINETILKPKESVNDNAVLSDKEINDLAAKVIKAELLGNIPLATELKVKLDKARQFRKENPKIIEEECVILTTTNTKGLSRPLDQPSSNRGSYSTKQKKRKIETHVSGERIRYFEDDDKYSLKDMFEQEKYGTAYDHNAEFIKMTAKVNAKDDLDDIFTEKISKKESESKTDSARRDRAIREHQTISKSLENCYHCFDSSNMEKHLIISHGEEVYISLPSYKSLTEGHCFIIPTKHITCATMADENVWNEIQDHKKLLSSMFDKENLTTVFFEHVTDLHKYPHMIIQCVPLPREEGDLAPIYFKKAILECETEWSTNKKLVDLKGSNVRKKVPKGLPYFCVDFGLNSGFAHIIEDRKEFPRNFAQEIIGGMLDLHHSLWRKPSRENFDEQKNKVDKFKKKLNNFKSTEL